MTTPDFRALCAELIEKIDYTWGDVPEDVLNLMNCACNALAEPVGEEPTDEELLKTYCDARRAFYFEAAEGESDQEDRKAATIAGLRAALAPVRASGQYRAIIIDCPPSMGMLSMNSLSAADHLLIALQCEYMALEGLGQILRNLDRIKNAVNPELALGGVVMTMFDMRTNLSRQVVEEVKKHLPEQIFKTVIPRTVRLSEAPSFGKTIFAYDPASPGSTAYRHLAKEVIERFGLGTK